MKGVYSPYVFSTNEAISALLILVATAFIFLIAAGWTLLESGQLRYKHSHFPMIKNLLMICVAVWCWWLVGYGLGYGDAHKFVGNDGYYFGSKGFEKLREDNYIRWVIEFAYVALVVLFASGPLNERCRMIAFVLLAFFLSFFIYPVVVAWVWGNGWLESNGFHDFAGSGVIHMVAGLCGFWGAVFLGRRYGRQFYRRPMSHEILNPRGIERIIATRSLDDLPFALRDLAQRDDYRPSNQLYIVVGCLVFWAGYLFFLGGKTYNMFTSRDGSAGKIFENTFLAGAAGGLTAVLVKPCFLRTYRHVSYYDC